MIAITWVVTLILAYFVGEFVADNKARQRHSERMSDLVHSMANKYEAELADLRRRYLNTTVAAFNAGGKEAKEAGNESAN